jgi:hypothetical protein
MLLFILMVALGTVLLAVWIIGRLLAFINRLLNAVYLSALDPRKTDYIKNARSFVFLMGKDDKHRSNLKLWGEIKKRGFRFVALIGIIVLSTGFVLQLLGY